MPKCFKCLVTIANLKLFSTHLRRHGLEKSSLFDCAEDGCNLKNISRMDGLIRHYKNVHKMSDNGESKIVQVQNVQIEENSEESVLVDDINPLDISAENDQSFYAPKCAENLKEELNLFIANLYCNPKINRTQIQDIIEHTETMVTSIVSEIKPLVLQLMQLAENHPTVTHLNDIFYLLENPFRGLHSEYMRIKTYSESGTFVAPQVCKIGEEPQAGNISGSNQTVLTRPLTALHIPLRSLMKTFLQEPGVMKRILEYREFLSKNSTFLSNVVHGESWKKMSANPVKFLLPMFLYNDDFECGNALGDVRGIHKITGVYVNMPFLPPEFISSLDNIFVIFLHHSSEKKRAGLYRKVIDEFKFLYEEGISIECQNFQGKVYFGLALLTGDNLALHSILGLAEGFRANHPCRMCKAHKSVIATQCEEDISLRRNIENYSEDLQQGNLTATGVKEKCVFDEIPGFNWVEQVGVDLHHDLLEGVCVYDLTLVINHCLENNFFTLSFLNNRIKFFDYGMIDKSEKPPLLGFDKGSVVITMSATHMYIFTKYLGLIIGDKIPEKDPAWELYVLLRKILDLLLRPFFPKEHIPLLKSLITEHHEVYLELSADKILKPKFHHMVHYPWMIERHGPLLHQWVMRMEALHKIQKTIALSIASRVNLTTSMGIRLQLAFHGKLKTHSFLQEKFDAGPSSQLNIENITSYNSVKEQIPDHLKIVESPSWLKIKGTMYKRGMILITGYLDFSPTFAKIINIYFHSKQVYFLCSKLETQYFDEHYFGFKVMPTDSENIFVQLTSLPHPFPCVLSTSGIGKLFVLYKYAL